MNWEEQQDSSGLGEEDFLVATHPSLMKILATWELTQVCY